MEYLVPPTDAQALTALKQMEFNYLKYRIKLLEDKTIIPKIKDALENRDIDPRDLTLDQLYAIRDRVRMYGFKRGVLNTTDGFTHSYFGEPQRRLTDNRIIFPLPPAGAKRDGLMKGLPVGTESYIEEDDPSWFPVVEE